MKHVYSAKYKKWTSDTTEREVKVVASSIYKAIIAIRRVMKREYYGYKDILSIKREDKIDAIE